MNEKYNNMMLCIIVSICLILIVSFGYHSIEKFTNLNVYQHRDTMIQRLINDPDVKRHLISNYKTLDRENNDTINNTNIDIAELNLGQDKINQLVNKVKQLTKEYNHNKLNLDKSILNKFNISANNSVFNAKNAEIKEKIKLYKDNIELLQKGVDSNVKILKNHFTNKELSIKKVTKDNNDNVLYFLVVNIGCLEMESKGKYKVTSCSNSNYKQLYVLNKIENYQEYNHYIKMGEQIESTNYVSQDDNILYPFYILIPYTILGHCITYKNNELSVRPINNDVYQRFDLRTFSTACQ